jgi:hypothetical protein
MESEQKKKSFWFTKWGILLILLFFPFFIVYWGIIKQKWNPLVKVGAIIGIFIIFIVGTATTQPNNASVLSSQTTISPVQKTEITHSIVSAAPTVTPKPTAIPTVTPIPTSIPVPTRYIAPTAVYVQPTTPPSNTSTSTNTVQQSSSNNTCDGTAICSDGWCSHAAHHQGACSSHGGVAQWL